MRKVAELVGAELDYYVARAEGVPAAELEIRATGTLCVRNLTGTPGKTVAVVVLDYSTNWALTGPLLEKHRMYVDRLDVWVAATDTGPSQAGGIGPTPLIAICRAVVRAAFGDEVEDLP